MKARPRFETRSIDQLSIDDERSFDHVSLYAELKEVLRRSDYQFRLLPEPLLERSDHALFLNLTYWASVDGGDVLMDEHLAADVVTHVAWHHLASRALSAAGKGGPSAAALFLGESIASAFDVYLVGRLLGHSPDSEFLETQVVAMAEAAATAGLSERGFAQLLEALAASPEEAFASLRALLFDAMMALFRCESSEEALDVLASFESHRFAPLLHHYELSNWVLYARAYARDAVMDEATTAIERALREAAQPIEWLCRHWVAPALAKSLE